MNSQKPMHNSECMIQCWKIPELKQFKIPAKSFRLLFRYFIICYSAVIFSLPDGQAGKFEIRYSKLLSSTIFAEFSNHLYL